VTSCSAVAHQSFRQQARERGWTSSPVVRRAYLRVVALRERLSRPFLRHVTLERFPVEVATQLAYEVLLGRAADPGGLATYVPRMLSGAITRTEMVQWVRGSSEFESRRAFNTWSTFGPSIHVGRCRFIRALPRGRRIVDLGGVSLGDPRGALVSAGYPYRFESLMIVDLPSDERHELYKSSETSATQTELGPVTYRYHSMADLSGIDDDSTDLVYSGQSIEHVTPSDGLVVMKEVWRILRPGGHFALDTPNAKVTRIQQEAFIDPDHKVEYTWAELRQLLEGTGFTIDWSVGINYAGKSVETGQFDVEDTAANCGLFSEIEDSYILAVVASKPGP
jgi:hypothetical protein